MSSIIDVDSEACFGVIPESVARCFIVDFDRSTICIEKVLRRSTVIKSLSPPLKDHFGIEQEQQRLGNMLDGVERPIAAILPCEACRHRLLCLIEKEAAVLFEPIKDQE